MNEKEDSNNRQIFRRLLRSVAMFLKSPSGGKARWLLGGLLLLMFCINGMNVANSYVGRYFMSAIEGREMGGFVKYAWLYVAVFAASTLVGVLFRFTEERLGLLWRDWLTRRITGDNMRERPYNAIYPRVTTRSNVYTVYVKAQALKQTKSTLDGSPDTFTEGKDQVESAFQASYTFERYLDPNAPASLNDTDVLGPYKMRVINQRNLSW